MPSGVMAALFALPGKVQESLKSFIFVNALLGLGELQREKEKI
jgi:hypothetical protein